VSLSAFMEFCEESTCRKVFMQSHANALLDEYPGFLNYFLPAGYLIGFSDHQFFLEKMSLLLHD